MPSAVNVGVQERIFVAKQDLLTSTIKSYAAMTDEELSANVPRIRERLALLDAENDKQVDEFGKIAGPMSMSSYEQDAFATDRWFLFGGMALGLLMAGLGTASWYFLHQRYQDAVLREQARQKNAV